MTRGVIHVRAELIPSRQLPHRTLQARVETRDGLPSTTGCEAGGWVCGATARGPCATATKTVTVTGSVRPGLEIAGIGTSKEVGVTPYEHFRRDMTAAHAKVVDEYLVADICSAGPEWMEFADVVVQRDGRNIAAAGPSAGFASAFARYPGCFVAAILDVGHGHLVATRDGQTIYFTPRLPPGEAACRTGPAADLAADWDSVLACISATHLWATQARRLAELDSVSLLIAGPSRTARHFFTCRPRPTWLQGTRAADPWRQGGPVRRWPAGHRPW